MYYVYIIQRLDYAKYKYYIGYTNNLKRRFKEHQEKYGNIKLIYYEAFESENLARTRERKLKQYGSAWRGLKQRLNIA